MLDFLSDESWINPQIDYLLWLQNLRISAGGVFDNFFLSLTKLGELSYPTLLMCLVYWCIDSTSGLYIFTLNALTMLVTQGLKMVACVYRPWIISSDVKPVAAAFRTAGGYSFPSGHSAMSSSVLGGLAYVLKKHKIVSSLLIIVVMLVGFSRNYLGVHTPQDVIVGLSTGFLFIFIVDFIIKWCEKDKNRYLYLGTVINLLSILVMIFVFTRSYPMDYVDGKLLVNPQKAIYTTIFYYGWMLGILNGVVLCRRFFPFDAKSGGVKNRILRGVLGTICFSGFVMILENYFWGYLRDFKLTFAVTFFIGFFLTAIYPLIFEWVEGRLNTKTEAN